MLRLRAHRPIETPDQCDPFWTPGRCRVLRGRQHFSGTTTTSRTRTLLNSSADQRPRKTLTHAQRTTGFKRCFHKLFNYLYKMAFLYFPQASTGSWRLPLSFPVYPCLGSSPASTIRQRLSRPAVFHSVRPPFSRLTHVVVSRIGLLIGSRIPYRSAGSSPHTTGHRSGRSPQKIVVIFDSHGIAINVRKPYFRNHAKALRCVWVERSSLRVVGKRILLLIVLKTTRSVRNKLPLFSYSNAFQMYLTFAFQLFVKLIYVIDEFHEFFIKILKFLLRFVLRENL